MYLFQSKRFVIGNDLKEEVFWHFYSLLFVLHRLLKNEKNKNVTHWFDWWHRWIKNQKFNKVSLHSLFFLPHYISVRVKIMTSKLERILLPQKSLRAYLLQRLDVRSFLLVQLPRRSHSKILQAAVSCNIK